MMTRTFPATGWTVFPMALGTADYGARYPEEFCFRQLDQFVAGGGTLLDTAHVYSDWISGELHRSERTLGRWLRTSGLRDSVRIVSKGAHPPLSDMRVSRVREADIRQDLSEGLDMLGCGAIDLYLLHRDDPSVPVGEIVDWMDAHCASGEIRAWGVSNWTLERIRAAQEYAAAHGRRPMACNEPMWSFATIRKAGLGDQTLVPFDAEMHRYHCETGLGLMAYSSQAQGYFSKMASARADGTPFPPHPVYGGEENETKFAFLQDLAKKTGLTFNQLTLLFFAKQPFCAIPIAAFGSETRLAECMAAFSDEAVAAVADAEYPLTPLLA